MLYIWLRPNLLIGVFLRRFLPGEEAQTRTHAHTHTHTYIYIWYGSFCFSCSSLIPCSIRYPAGMITLTTFCLKPGESAPQGEEAQQRLPSRALATLLCLLWPWPALQVKEEGDAAEDLEDLSSSGPKCWFQEGWHVYHKATHTVETMLIEHYRTICKTGRIT